MPVQLSSVCGACVIRQVFWGVPNFSKNRILGCPRWDGNSLRRGRTLSGSLPPPPLILSSSSSSKIAEIFPTFDLASFVPVLSLPRLQGTGSSLGFSLGGNRSYTFWPNPAGLRGQAWGQPQTEFFLSLCTARWRIIIANNNNNNNDKTNQNNTRASVPPVSANLEILSKVCQTPHTDSRLEKPMQAVTIFWLTTRPPPPRVYEFQTPASL